MTEPGGDAKARAPSGTVTFLFSDVEGKSSPAAEPRSDVQEAPRLRDRVMREAIAANGGHVFKTAGETFYAAFVTPESATIAALEAQRSLAEAGFGGSDQLRVRIAINTGTADERDGDYFGPALNRVARLLALAHGGQVLLSSVAAELVRENLPPETTLRDLGKHTLKDLAGRERVYQLVAPHLQLDFPELSALEATQPWLVPDAMRTRYFTGRSELIGRLRAQLVERHCAALSGLGGVGKTQTAIEYAIEYRTEYPNGVFWVNAETLSGLTGGFVDIAATLQLPAAGSENQEQAISAVLEWLKRSDRWLLVLDNVDDRSEMRRFVDGYGKGDLLITSREPVFAELGIPRALEVPDLDAADATGFLLARTGRVDAESADRIAAAELATELGNLPLALEQAAAYIAETNASFAGYVSAFRKRRVALLEKALGLVSHETVAVTWAANFEAVAAASPAAADVLRLSALLAPDAIPFEMFLDGAPLLGDPIAQALADPDELAMAEILRPLARYSLVRSNRTSRSFSVHRLVQAIVWKALTESERRTYVDGALRALDAAFPAVAFANWGRCERLLAHVVSIAGPIETYAAPPETAARLLDRTGRYLCDRGRYAEAQSLHERALAIAERAFGNEHAAVAHSLRNLAVVHWYQGQYAHTERLNARALAIQERVLGPDHIDISSSLNLHGILRSKQGRYAEAARLYERALAIRERVLGGDHSSVADCLSNLGIDRREQGRYDEVVPLFERALAIRERALGPDHPDTAGSLDNLGEVYQNLGRYAEARPLHERALAVRERATGPDHPDVGFSFNALANLELQLGRFEEAAQLFERAIAVREHAFGTDHPDLGPSLTGLANVYVHQGHYAEAEPLLERALAIRERQGVATHLAESLAVLASLRAAQGRPAEALAHFERALTLKERVFSADHPELAEFRDAIAALRATIEREENAG